MDDLLQEFLVETAEGLALLDREMLDFERAPRDKEKLGAIFRGFHTIKGTCGFLGLPRLEQMAHAAETVLSRYRDARLEVTPSGISLLLEALDRIKWITAHLGEHGQEPPGDDHDLITRVSDMAALPADLSLPESAPSSGAKIPARPAKPAAPVPQTTGQESGQAASAATESRNSLTASQPAEHSIRVSVDLLESLMTTVSELVLTRNQLLQIMRSQPDAGGYAESLQRLNHLTTELQENVVKTRMQPIGNAWAKLPRMIRDMAHDLGKQIELEMEGAETELDRQVLELIKAPLMHMVRNAADHGIESPEERQAAGKREPGRITLSAFHKGSHIIIGIADNGRGMQIGRIKAKALQKGIASESQLDAMPDQQLLQFIFLPGFSTAENITAISGRGVGMDVVKANIEKIGGMIELSSQPGIGSRFTLKIPLTLAIISALIVGAADHRFAIPQVSVIELLRPSKRAGIEIEFINKTPVLRRHDRLLPLISLRHELKLADSEKPVRDTISDSYIVVTQSGANRWGIIVDRIFDTEEIVVKPVSAMLRGISMFSGNTILGDGAVVMILDPGGISAGHEVDRALSAPAEPETSQPQTEKMQLLLFRSHGGLLKAVPLPLVTRLEKMPFSAIEYSEDRSIVQYRGGILPVLPLAGESIPRKTGDGHILIFADRERRAGVSVGEVVDIIDTSFDIELASARPGSLGSGIIGGRTADILDVPYYLNEAWHNWFDSDERPEAAACSKMKKLLLVDDSAFFRNLLTPILSVAGYHVTAAASVEQALALRNQGQSFDGIISDIAMPDIDGFSFARMLRTDILWSAIPMIALSSHATPQDIAASKSAGFIDHVPKFDRNRLLNALEQIFADISGEAAEKSSAIIPQASPDPETADYSL